MKSQISKFTFVIDLFYNILKYLNMDHKIHEKKSYNQLSSAILGKQMNV